MKRPLCLVPVDIEALSQSTGRATLIVRDKRVVRKQSKLFNEHGLLVLTVFSGWLDG